MDFSNISQMGFFAEAGPVQIFVSKHVSLWSCIMNLTSSSFLVLGVLYLLFFSSFLSPQLIPDDMEFQAGDMPNYTTSDGSVCFFLYFLFPTVLSVFYLSSRNSIFLCFLQVKIQKECEVRLKIIGTRVDATEIVCTISITLFTIQLIVRFLGFYG